MKEAVVEVVELLLLVQMQLLTVVQVVMAALEEMVRHLPFLVRL